VVVPGAVLPEPEFVDPSAPDPPAPVTVDPGGVLPPPDGVVFVPAATVVLAAVVDVVDVVDVVEVVEVVLLDEPLEPHAAVPISSTTAPTTAAIRRAEKVRFM
jgi:hypothetical protein